MQVNIIYGTDSGSTAAAADTIAAKFAGARVVNVRNASVVDFEQCDLLILGSPTYGFGDLQDDWMRALQTVAAAALAGHKVALFGTGDQVSYPDSFVDALGTLYDAVRARDADIVGFTDIDATYTFEASKARRDGRFVGLVLDEDNQHGKSRARVDAWVKTLQ